MLGAHLWSALAAGGVATDGSVGACAFTPPKDVTRSRIVEKGRFIHMSGKRITAADVPPWSGSADYRSRAHFRPRTRLLMTKLCQDHCYSPSSICQRPLWTKHGAELATVSSRVRFLARETLRDWMAAHSSKRRWVFSLRPTARRKRPCREPLPAAALRVFRIPSRWPWWMRLWPEHSCTDLSCGREIASFVTFGPGQSSS